jgi:hypothetical protein
MSNILFSNIGNRRIKNIFRDTVNQFPELNEMKIILRQTRIKGSTMQAQPVINTKSVINGIDTFRIRLSTKVRDSRSLKVTDLPDDVLMGWFAHELGHVIDYHSRSVVNMVGFGLKYIVSRSFRLEAEHTADKIAIEKGFLDQILATKKYILDHHLIEDAYKSKIKRYYMSEKDARTYALAQVAIDPID